MNTTKELLDTIRRYKNDAATWNDVLDAVLDAEENTLERGFREGVREEASFHNAEMIDG